MTLGERIKELRVLRKMTREQIAERCNISTSTVSRWEGNRATPTRAHRLLLADVLQVDENSLFVTPEVSIPENVLIEQIIGIMKEMSPQKQNLLLYMALGLRDYEEVPKNFPDEEVKK
ncbi:XRE family transcriptional regulator [Neglecta sp. X4]|nr:XRE family transcriptional regulator [Neglectibacter sp. 59]NBJ74623.1 XRE family transcriptional regulator [Neglectibacter sp. X4]NCE82440.1 XRE family transcriptional regulator [Neglectibacter sp. X58]